MQSQWYPITRFISQVDKKGNIIKRTDFLSSPLARGIMWRYYSIHSSPVKLYSQLLLQNGSLYYNSDNKLTEIYTAASRSNVSRDQKLAFILLKCIAVIFFYFFIFNVWEVSGHYTICLKPPISLHFFSNIFKCYNILQLRITWYIHVVVLPHSEVLSSSIYIFH